MPGRLQYGQVIRWLSDKLPEDAIIAGGAGNFAGWLHRHFRYKGFRTQLGSTNGSMGYGYPAAVAAKLTAPSRTVLASSLTDHRHRDAPLVRGRAVLPNIETLPGAEREVPFDDRDADRRLRQHAANVRGHVVIALGRMREKPISIGHEARDEGFEIATHRWIRVLAHDQ